MNGVYQNVVDFIGLGRMERLKAENEQLRASLDYVAMMTDVELLDENNSEESYAQPEVSEG